jgi:hypothetical protein
MVIHFCRVVWLRCEQSSVPQTWRIRGIVMRSTNPLICAQRGQIVMMSGKPACISRRRANSCQPIQSAEHSELGRLLEWRWTDEWNLAERGIKLLASPKGRIPGSQGLPPLSSQMTPAPPAGLRNAWTMSTPTLPANTYAVLDNAIDMPTSTNLLTSAHLLPLRAAEEACLPAIPTHLLENGRSR